MRKINKYINYIKNIKYRIPFHLREGIKGQDLLGIGTLASGIFQGIAGMVDSKRQRQFIGHQWDKENAYNAPIEQMKRLKEAGLNPNLAYGNGTVSGNTSPHVSQVPDSNTKALAQGASQGLQQMVSLQQMKLQNDNIKADTDNKIALGLNIPKTGQNIDAKTNEANTSAFLKNLQGSGQSLENQIKQITANYSPDVQAEMLRQLKLKNTGQGITNATAQLNLDNLPTMLKQQIAKTGAEISNLEQNVVYKIYNNSQLPINQKLHVMEAMSRVENLRQQNQNLSKDELLKQFEIELEKRGLSKNSNMFLRMYAETLENKGYNTTLPRYKTITNGK